MTLKPLLHAIGVTTVVTPDVRETRKDRNECTKRCFTRSDFLLQSCGIHHAQCPKNEKSHHE